MSHGSTTSTILIVDHNPAALSMKRRLLSRESYRIIEAENGTDALMLAAAELPDLVLLDANLPDIDSFDACRQLKTQSQSKFMKILQTSAARMNAPDQAKKLDVGPDAYLVEPLEEEELIGIVRALLKLAQQERDNLQLAEKLSRAERQLSAATEAALCTERKQTEQTLRESEERFAKAFRASPHPIGITEVATGRCIEVNDACLQLFGFGREEVIGNTTLMLGIWPNQEDRARLVKRLVKRLKAGEPVRNLELSFKMKSGALRHILVSSDLVKINGTLCLITVGNDITDRKRTEEKLRESEERLRLFIEHAPTAIAMLNREMCYLAVSRRFKEDYRIIGDPIGQSHYELFPEIPERWKEMHHRGLNGEVLKADADPFVRSDGTTQYVKWEVRPWHAADGAIGGILIAAEEVTARVRAVQALRESEARFRTMAEAVPSFLFETDAAGWNTWTSEGWCRFTGQTSEQAAGHGWAEALHPDDRLANIDRWLRCMKDGVPFEAQQRLRRTDGSYAWVIARALPVRDDQGRISRWVGSVTDVDAIVCAEAEQARLGAIVESTCDAIIGKDVQGTITSWNRGAETLLGYTAAEAIGRAVTMLFPPDRMDEEPTILNRLQKGEYIRQYETVRRRKDGRDIHVALTISPIRDKQSRIIGASTILRDITARKQADEQLRENHRFITEMTAVLPGVLYIFDLQQQRNIYVNRHTGAVLGYSAEEIHVLGKDFIPTILHPDDAIRLLQYYESFKELEDGVTAQVEYRFRHRDGTYRWFLSRDVVWERSADGHVRQILGMATDISEWKQAEQQLRDSEAQLQAAMSAGAVGTWMWDIVNDNVVANPTFARIFGLDPDHVQRGLPVGTFLAAIHSDDRPRVETAIAEALKSGGKYEEEYRVRNTDKQWRWVVARGRVEYDATRKPVRFPGTLIDITERRLAEAALRESEARFRNVFEHAGTGIAIAELDGSFVQCNPAYCAMLGYTEDELRCLRFPELIHPEDRAGNVAGIERLIGGEIPYFEVENRYVNKNGEPVWAHKFVSLLRNHAGESKYLVALVTNVTDRRKAEQELREAQEHLRHWNIELEQAVNEKTVELRQSQERIRAFASELNLAEQRERKRLATELHDHLQQTLVLGKLTMGQGKRLAAAMPACLEVMKKADDVFSEALTYTRTLVAELSPPVLRDRGLAAGLKWLGGYMQKYNLTVTVTVPEAMKLKVPEDQAVLLFQSVRELLMNAWKHAGTGKASVILTHVDDRLLITVSDKGVGFDLAAAATAKPTVSGVSSKFGLFSIEERMHSLGGSFGLHSVPGQGTTATLSLPLAGTGEKRMGGEKKENGARRVVREVQEGPSSSSLHAPRTARHTSPIRVLLVDDHAMVRQGLRAVLESYEDMDVVGEAVDGQDAIRLAEQLRPGIVVMDINMPKMNGIEATREMTTRYPDVAVIGLSVNAGDDNHDAMTKAGALRLMTKEAAVEELYGAIQEAVKRE